MLDISRKDILSGSIMDFDAATRFIKLPISEYLNLLGTTPNSAQVALINAIKKEYKVNTLDEIRNIAEKWAPYKTIATLYLWESLEDDFPS